MHKELFVTCIITLSYNTGCNVSFLKVMYTCIRCALFSSSKIGCGTLLTVGAKCNGAAAYVEVTKMYTDHNRQRSGLCIVRSAIQQRRICKPSQICDQSTGHLQQCRWQMPKVTNADPSLLKQHQVWFASVHWNDPSTVHPKWQAEFRDLGISSVDWKKWQIFLIQQARRVLSKTAHQPAYWHKMYHGPWHSKWTM